MSRSTRSSNGFPYTLSGGQSYVHSRVLIVAARVKESNDRAEVNTVMKRTMLKDVWIGDLRGEELRGCTSPVGWGDVGLRLVGFYGFQKYIPDQSDQPGGGWLMTGKKYSVTAAGWMTMTAKACAVAPRGAREASTLNCSPGNDAAMFYFNSFHDSLPPSCILA